MSDGAVEVECPLCMVRAANRAGNRAERRAADRQRRRCPFCGGTGTVTKSVPHRLSDLLLNDPARLSSEEQA